jgi:hypothetical protein
MSITDDNESEKRMLAKNINKKLNGGAKKSTSKKTSKKASKKASKKTSKKAKMSRQTDNEIKFDNTIGDDSSSSGDDERDNADDRSSESGKKYKKIIKKLKDELSTIKKSKKKSKKTSNKRISDNSSTFTLSDSDKKNNIQTKNSQHIENAQYNNVQQNNDNGMVMLPNDDNQIAKLKIGKNTDMNIVMNNINDDEHMIPIIPEMQQMFDINQYINNQQPQNNEHENYNYSGQPQIMDQSIINMANAGKLPLPILNGINHNSGMNQMPFMNPSLNMNQALNMNPSLNNLGSAGLAMNKPPLPMLNGGSKKKDFFLKSQ